MRTIASYPATRWFDMSRFDRQEVFSNLQGGMTSDPMNSPDPIDDLLAQLQPAVHPPAAPMPQPDSPALTPANSTGSLDHLLSELQAIDQACLAAPNSLDSIAPVPPIVPATNPQFEALLHPHPVEPPRSGTDSTERLLAEIQDLYTDQDQQAAAKATERQASQQRQRRAKVVRQAQAWLDSLDHNTSEAAWFEEFATKYSSRVEAAVDFLGLSWE